MSLSHRLFDSLHRVLVLPYSARVILGPSDYGIALVIERTRKDFFFMPFQHLDLVASVCGPDPASLVAAGSDDLVALRVERDL